VLDTRAFRSKRTYSHRIASAIVSGVGFLGAGVITQPVTVTECPTTEPRGAASYEVRPVHGLTTAAAIWMSAAVGVSAAAGLPLLTLGGALLTAAVLKLPILRGARSSGRPMEEAAKQQPGGAIEDTVLVGGVRENS
jgi:putative Mg2+ transporter-C (MgtC) family protein